MEKGVDRTSEPQDDDNFRDQEDEGSAGDEPGRVRTEDKGESGRPTGKSTGRDSTGINPEDPIDPKSPNLIGP